MLWSSGHHFNWQGTCEAGGTFLARDSSPLPTAILPKSPDIEAWFDGGKAACNQWVSWKTIVRFYQLCRALLLGTLQWSISITITHACNAQLHSRNWCPTLSTVLRIRSCATIPEKAARNNQTLSSPLFSQKKSWFHQRTLLTLEGFKTFVEPVLSVTFPPIQNSVCLNLNTYGSQ